MIDSKQGTYQSRKLEKLSLFAARRPGGCPRAFPTAPRAARPRDAGKPAQRKSPGCRRYFVRHAVGGTLPRRRTLLEAQRLTASESNPRSISSCYALRRGHAGSPRSHMTLLMTVIALGSNVKGRVLHRTAQNCGCNRLGSSGFSATTRPANHLFGLVIACVDHIRYFGSLPESCYSYS